MSAHRFILTLLASLIVSIWAGIASAGDAAKLNILGFSHDGAVFAFEQYGVQDGSGFPYAERFYITTQDDRFLSNTPLRVRLDDEMATLDAARNQAQIEAEEASNIADTALSMDNTTLAASHAITQNSGNPHFMQFTPRAIFPAIDAPIALQLNEKDLLGSELCQQVGGQKGFELLLSTVESDQTWQILHDDQTVPQSRACPVGYRLHQAITHYPEGRPPILVVIIAIRSFGFEGPDHRYMAIAHQLPIN